jgi:hypothetical protein
MSFGAGPFTDLLTQVKGSTGEKTAAAAPFWGDNPDAWDAVFIANVRLPGLAKVGGKGFEQRVDAKKTAGKHGASITRTGNEPARVEIQVQLWTEEHLVAYEKLIRQVKPRKAEYKTVTKATYDTTPKVHRRTVSVGYAGGRASTSWDYEEEQMTLTIEKKRVETAKEIGGPVDIYHPALAIFGIRSVVVLSATLPEYGDKGIYSSRIECIEYVAPAQSKAAVDTARKSKADITSLPTAFGKRINKATPADDNTGPT